MGAVTHLSRTVDLSPWFFKHEALAYSIFNNHHGVISGFSGPDISASAASTLGNYDVYQPGWHSGHYLISILADAQMDM